MVSVEVSNDYRVQAGEGAFEVALKGVELGFILTSLIVKVSNLYGVLAV